MAGPISTGGVVFSALAPGGLHTLGLSTSGAVYAWGSDTFGQLGNGAAGPSASPFPIVAPPGVTFTAIAAGSTHSLALSSTGTVYAWGANRFGQLGIGTLEQSTVPVAVSVPGVTFTAIAAGGFDSYALSSEGAVYAWGANFYGQLGDGSTTAMKSPVLVSTPAGITFTGIATGGGHALAVGADGSLYAWGDNIAGQLGDGTNVDRRTPVAVGTAIAQVAAGSADSIALTTSGKVLVWGSGILGQLGNGGTIDSDFPVAPSLPSSAVFAAVTGGANSLYALASTGVVWTWGADFYGQLGDGGRPTATTGQLVPETLTLPNVPLGTLVAGIYSGPDASMAAILTPKSQTVTLPSIPTPTYGDPPIAFQPTASSGLHVTVSAAGACTASSTRVFLTAAGPCTLTASQDGSVQYYASPSATETFNVAPAPLTVTPADASTVAGGPMPTFSSTVTGFKNGDTSAVLSGSPSCTTTATPSSPPGQYPITCTQGTLGAANYVFVSGPTATLTLTLGNGGYAVIGADGSVWTMGPSVPFAGSMAGQPLNAPVVGAAFTPFHDGYWLVASDGGIFSFGDAPFYGSMGGRPLNRPIVGIASTPDGRGYWEVASDGGIFSFGDAQFYGSTGSMVLNQPVVGMAATSDGQGYWLVAADGGIFAFGDAQFYGSAGGNSLGQHIVGMATTPSGQGYWMATTTGGVYSFGDATFQGSLRYLTLAKPVVGIAASSVGAGYWLTSADGALFAFGSAGYFGRVSAPPAPVVGIV